MKLGVAAICVCLWPAATLACRTPPHAAGAFEQDSYVSLPGCEGQFASQCQTDGITSAWFNQPTSRYGHGVLGDAIEGGGLSAYTNAYTANSCGTVAVTLDAAHVFEDTQPRLVDVDGDGAHELLVVRSHVDKGAQIAIYAQDENAEALTLLATTPYIGRRNRWFAPIGAADLDGDGLVEIAYIDRPHLAKTLRVWRYEGGALTEVGSYAGVTNHRIGEPDIAGGIRDCGAGPEMVVATADWQSLLAVRFDGVFAAVNLGQHAGRASFADALNCKR